MSTSDRQDIKSFKHEGYHKEVNSGIEITETRGDEDVSRCSLSRRKVVTVGEVRIPRRTPVRHEGSPSSPRPPHEVRALFLMVSFSSTPEMASSTTTSQSSRRRRPRASPQSSTKRSPRSQPPNRLGGHPPRVTSTRGLTRTNRTGELKPMQPMQGKNTRSAQILLSQIPQKQQVLGRNRRGRTMEEVNK